jgi:hypothetical protein
MEQTLALRSVLRLNNEGQLTLRESLETAITSVGGWCEMAASLRGPEPGSRECPLSSRVCEVRSW